MKFILALAAVIAVGVAKPSGILAPHIHSVAYASPVHHTFVAEKPAVVHHKSVIADIPTGVSHQQSTVVHHKPAVIHQEAIVEPAVRHAFVAHEAPAVIHHEIAHAPAVVHHQVAHASAGVIAHASAAAAVHAVPGVVHHEIAQAGPAVVHHEFKHAAPALIHHEVAAPIIHHGIAQAAPAVVHHEFKHAAPALIHHEVAAPIIHHGIAQAAPAVVHHEFKHAAPAVIHHEVAAPIIHHEIAQAAPAVVHHEFKHAAPAVIHHEAAAPFIHHELAAPLVHQQFIPSTVVAQAAPAVVHHKSVIAEVPTAISEQHSTVVHKSAPIHHTVVNELPVVHQPVVSAVHQAVVSEPIGVKHTVSHQDSSIVHAAAIHHDVPVVHHKIVADAVPVSQQFHSQDALGQYSFGYTSPLSSKVEVKTLDGVTKGEFKYLDAFGKGQSVQYVSDDVQGFRAAASNLPVGPAPVVDTVEVAAAKAAHLAIHESAKAAAVKAGDVVHHEFSSGLHLAPALPSAFSYSYVAQQPIQQVVAQSEAIVHDLPVVGVAHDTVAVDAKIAPAFVHNIDVVPGVALTAAGVPVDTPEVAQAKAAHLAAFRANLNIKEEKPCD